METAEKLLAKALAFALDDSDIIYNGEEASLYDATADGDSIWVEVEADGTVLKFRLHVTREA